MSFAQVVKVEVARCGPALSRDFPKFLRRVPVPNFRDECGRVTFTSPTNFHHMLEMDDVFTQHFGS